MDRIRGGDFCYNEHEYEIMFADAANMLEQKADGIVFGFLNQDKTINIVKTKEMVKLIHFYHREAVFHKAFDEIEDLDKACETLLELGIDRILTSGKAVYPDIISGCKTISLLHQKYGEKLQFLPGGGVRTDNICEVITATKTGQIHMTSKKEYPGGYLGLDEIQLQQMLESIRTI
jgi:copper homeostasis protein